MRIERVLSVERVNPNEKGIDLARHMTAREQLSLLEDLRIEMSKVAKYEYPQRLRRVLEITKRNGEIVSTMERGGTDDQGSTSGSQTSVTFETR